jgi:hypothetical protein
LVEQEDSASYAPEAVEDVIEEEAFDVLHLGNVQLRHLEGQLLFVLDTLSVLLPVEVFVERNVHGLHEERHINLVEGQNQLWSIHVTRITIVELVKNYSDHYDEILEEDGVDEVG